MLYVQYVLCSLEQQRAVSLRLCLYDIMSCASLGCPTASGPLVHTHLFESHSMTDPYSENERNKEVDSF